MSCSGSHEGIREKEDELPIGKEENGQFGAMINDFKISKKARKGMERRVSQRTCSITAFWKV